MDETKISDFERTAREIVHAAMLEGTLSSLTIRRVRDRIETMHGLEHGFLLAPQYRHSLKTIIQLMTSDRTAQEASLQAKMGMRDEETRVRSKHTVVYESDGGEEGVHNARTSKKQLAAKYKSAEFVEDSSDLEELPERKSVSLEKKSPKDQVKREEPPLKKRRKIVDSDNESVNQVPEKSKSKMKIQMDFAESDEEIASLFGDSLKPKKAQTCGKKPRIEKASGSKSKGEAPDKHDATIKKLKSLVNACGVRKPWVKVFQDLPKPTQQIKKLKEILTELGMTGRMSMEQAKKIRAERELAQELEDVKSFEQSMLNRSRSRTAGSSSRSSVKHGEPEEDGDSEEDDINNRRRKISASRSIDAFIESDDD